jgi:hypothetical protein
VRVIRNNKSPVCAFLEATQPLLSTRNRCLDISESQNNSVMIRIPAFERILMSVLVFVSAVCTDVRETS